MTPSPAVGTNHAPRLAPISVVPATIDVEHAAAAIWDVVVVGGGPAGAAAAARLAAGGFRTLLVDRTAMPRGKVCGCCLSTAALRELDALALALDGPGDGPPWPLSTWPTGRKAGVFDGRRSPHPAAADCVHSPLAEMLACAEPLVGVRVLGGGREARLPLPGGAAISRERLDTELVRAAIAAGCDWLPEMDVVAVQEPPPGPHPLRMILRPRTVEARERSLDLRSRAVILAGGLTDAVRVIPAGAGAAPAPRRRIDAASRIGVGTVLDATAADLPAGALVMAVGRAGYCGLVRLEDGRIDVAAAIDPLLLRDGHRPGDALRTILADATNGRVGGWLDETALAAAACRATPRLTHRAAAVAGATGRVLRVGDAVGYVEPFTGEGIGWALAGARLVATALLASGAVAGSDPLQAAHRYERDHARHFRPRHARCRRVVRCLRTPRLVAGAVRAARWAPWAARRVVPLLVGHTDASRSRTTEGTNP
jgi:flavin-dependent dehydrogenase